MFMVAWYKYFFGIPLTNVCKLLERVLYNNYNMRSNAKIRRTTVATGFLF